MYVFRKKAKYINRKTNTIYMQAFTVILFKNEKFLIFLTKAAKEACYQMGNKQYLNLILFDSIQNSHKQITDDVDVACLKDYMQVK